MSYNRIDYWTECVATAAEECGVALTDEQLKYLADAVEGGADNVGQAFYTPPASDRLSVIEREAQSKLDALQREFDRYRNDAESAVRRALGQYTDANVSIGEGGDVFRHGGRTEQIQ